jgi:hypothetical protein
MELYGRDHLVYISSVLSHAPGIFSLVVTESMAVATAIDLVSGQSATMAGVAASLVWSYTGSGTAFLVGAGTSLQISELTLAAGTAFFVAGGSALSLASLALSL